MSNEVVVEAGRFELVFATPQLLGLEKLDGIGPKTAKRLKERGILDQSDLLLFMPRKYRKCGHFIPASDLMQTRMSYVEFQAPIMNVRLPTPNTKQPVEVMLNYEGQYFKLIWFNLGRSKSFTSQFKVGDWLHVKGSVDYARSVPVMQHPDIELLGPRTPAPKDDYISVEPVYTSLEGVKDAILRRAQLQVLARLLPELGDIVPGDVLEKRDLPGVGQALSIIHVLRPQHDVEFFQKQLLRAKNRIIYEEFYTLQLKLARDYAAQREAANAPQCTERELGRAVVRNLPFDLTGDQQKVMGTIAKEVGRKLPMRRLLQGDVGSGKTVVALMSAAIAIGSGVQVAMMAPTDILARQHLKRAEEFLEGLDIEMGFLGGSLGTKEKRAVLEKLADGTIKLIVGTHALFSDDVVFDNLGLVLVDEQHKFGVEQREQLLAKGEDPHLLSMTATPIPRSLAHAVFGDLDLSIIREKPPGRQPIKTYLRDRSKAPDVYKYVRERIQDTGEQAYFVYPMVEASEAVPDRKNVTEAAKELAEGPFADLRVGLLHGRLDSEEKARVMQEFSDGELDILCATTVIEVGVDVANATMMIIESPEVFGLSQLHQLRGRVGRGSASSMCILLAGFDLSKDAHERLVSFSKTDDGFKLAEVDLKIRGPGLFLGVRQAGHAEFRFGDLGKDGELLEMAREDARRRILGEEDAS